MKMEMKKLMPFLSFLFGFCLIFGAGYTFAKFAGVFDAGEFSLSIVEGEIDPGQAYTIYYHTFDENNNDVVLNDGDIVYENIPFELRSAPGTHDNLTFLGWSSQGTWISDEQSMFQGSLAYQTNSTLDSKWKRYFGRGGQTVMVADIRRDDTSNEIHLYDLYNELYIQIDLDRNSTNYKFELHVYGKEGGATTSTQPLFYRWYRGSDYTSGSSMFFKAPQDTTIHYMHPGMQYRINSSEYVNNDYPEKDYYTDIYLNGSLHDEDSFPFFTDTIVYVATIREQSNTDPNCIAAGTLITMADGSKLPVEQVQTGDMVRVFDHENGCYTSAPVLFTEYDGDAEWNVINLEFSDGTFQKFIYEHGLFDLDLNRYVYITEENYQDFIGHRFAKEETFGYSETTLINAYTQLEFTGCYSLTTEYHLNVFVNGMFSMPGGITGLFNFFEYDENLAYERELMAKDIETYGLFTYEEFAPYMSEETFNTIFPIKYLKVSVGKGLTSFEGLEYIIERYIYRHNLDG